MTKTGEHTFQELLSQAQQALEEMRLEDALAAYQAAEALQADSYDVQVGLARTFTRMRRQQEAITAAQRARELAPQRFEAHTLLGALHFLVDENTEAVEVLQRAIELAPDEPEPHLTLAQVYADTGQSDEAEEELAKAREQIASLPDEAAQRRWQALAFHVETYLRLAQRRDTEALEAAQQVVALEDANPYAACLAYSNMGIIQARQRKYDLAIEYLQQALALNPYFYRAGSALGRLLLIRGRAQEAASVLADVLQRAPQENGSTRYAYATALAKAGRRQEAHAQFRQALAEGLNGVDALVARAQTIWQSDVGRYGIIGILLLGILLWLALARPSPQVMTLLAVLALIVILQRTLGRRR